MTLFDLFRKHYVARVQCVNCGTVQDLKVPKGHQVQDYLDTESAVCENCGCSSLGRAVKSKKTELTGDFKIKAPVPVLEKPKKAQPKLIKFTKEDQKDKDEDDRDDDDDAGKNLITWNT